MLSFPQKTIKYIKEHLQKQQKEVEENLKEMEQDDPANSPALAESSEPGTDSYIADSHTKTLVLASQLKSLSSNIKKSLFKIKNKTYGKCEKCGKRIEISRLMVMPTAQYCLADSKKTP